MATKTTTVLIDDLDGKSIPEGTPTINFAYKGVSYSIDLTPANSEKFDAALAPFIAKARKGGRGTGAKSGTSTPSDPARLAAIREWAAKNGIEVNPVGRIPKATVEAFHAAQGK